MLARSVHGFHESVEVFDVVIDVLLEHLSVLIDQVTQSAAVSVVPSREPSIVGASLPDRACLESSSQRTSRMLREP